MMKAANFPTEDCRRKDRLEAEGEYGVPSIDLQPRETDQT